MVRRALLGVLVLILLVPPLEAAVTGIEIDGDEVRATVTVSGAAAELTLRFEEVVGLSAANLGVSAQLVDPLDPTLLGRLPGSLTSIPVAFPVLVEVDPPASGGLSFTGVVELEIYTHDLTYTAGCPLRMFAAHGGGPFEDISTWMGSGSYRIRGNKGNFSEFLIVTDLRPVDTVIGLKLDRVEALLDTHAGLIDASVLADLEDHLTNVRRSYEADQLVAAIHQIEAFTAHVEQHSGEEIPDVWRSSRDLVNVAGELRSAAMTLRFSLLLKSNGAS